MTCQRIGCSPMGTIGLGRNSASSLMRVPKPPHKMKTGMCAMFMRPCWPNLPLNERVILLLRSFLRERRNFCHKGAGTQRTKSEGEKLKPEGETRNLVSGFKFQIQFSSSASFQNFHQAQARDIVEGNGASAEQRRGCGRRNAQRPQSCRRQPGERRR